jgi:hypothetical protein
VGDIKSTLNGKSMEEKKLRRLNCIARFGGKIKQIIKVPSGQIRSA